MDEADIGEASRELVDSSTGTIIVELSETDVQTAGHEVADKATETNVEELMESEVQTEGHEVADTATETTPKELLESEVQTEITIVYGKRTQTEWLYSDTATEPLSPELSTACAYIEILGERRSPLGSEISDCEEVKGGARRTRRGPIRKEPLEEYFALTCQSIIMDPEANTKKISIEGLYAEVNQTGIPFNLWHDWIKTKLIKK